MSAKVTLKECREQYFLFPFLFPNARQACCGTWFPCWNLFSGVTEYLARTRVFPWKHQTLGCLHVFQSLSAGNYPFTWKMIFRFLVSKESRLPTRLFLFSFLFAILHIFHQREQTKYNFFSLNCTAIRGLGNKQSENLIPWAYAEFSCIWADIQLLKL